MTLRKVDLSADVVKTCELLQSSLKGNNPDTPYLLTPTFNITQHFWNGNRYNHHTIMMTAGIKYFLRAESRHLSSESSHCIFFGSVPMLWLTFTVRKVSRMNRHFQRIRQDLHFTFNDKIIWKMKMLQQKPVSNPWWVTPYNHILRDCTQSMRLTG
jgi:hypothetical protein